MGGIFTCYRYATDFPGLVGKDLTPGKKLEELIGNRRASRQPEPPRTAPVHAKG
jgi:hypothetical protein